MENKFCDTKPKTIIVLESDMILIILYHSQGGGVLSLTITGYIYTVRHIVRLPVTLSLFEDYMVGYHHLHSH